MEDLAASGEACSGLYEREGQEVPTGSVLSDVDILAALEAGDINIEPFESKNVNTSSYDVTLGENFWTQRKLAGPIDPTADRSVNALWERHVAKTSSTGKKEIVVKAGETILVHTNEFIGGINGITTEIKTRSTFARLCLNFAASGGWGDVGFVNRWTMVCNNFGTNDVVLTVGMRVAQIVFFRTGPTKSKYSGSYQEGEWSPESMVPRRYKL